MARTYTRKDLAGFWGCSLATADRRIKETENSTGVTLGETSEEDKRVKVYSSLDYDILHQKFPFSRHDEDDLQADDDFEIEFVEAEVVETSAITPHQMPTGFKMKRLNLDERNSQIREINQESAAATTMAHTAFHSMGAAIGEMVFTELQEFKAGLVHSAKAGMMQSLQKNAATPHVQSQTTNQ